jgi:hypothetical protein
MDRRYENPPIEVTRIWQEMGAPTVRTLDFETRSLERLYTFRRRAEVSQFLEKHPFLVPLLLEAYSEFGNYFGPYPQVFLEVVTDPEAADDRQLFAFISTRLSPDEALDRLEQFDKSWWLSALDRAEGNLCIHVEFL